MIRRAALALLFASALAACTPSARAPASTPALDKLFAELAEARSAAEAAQIEQRIYIVWSASGSPTVDILLERAQAAEAIGDFARGRALLDKAADILPDHAEIYSRRAALEFRAENLDQAVRDIERTLEREPRHFGAYVGLGMIYESQGHERAALEAYQAALDLDPWLDAAKQGVARLKPSMEGRES